MEHLKSKIINPASLLNYQKDAVVSQTLIKQESGTITLFAFASGQGLSEHTTPFDATVYIVDGDAEIQIEQDSYRLSHGEMIILPANKPHAVHAISNFKMLLIMIKT